MRTSGGANIDGATITLWNNPAGADPAGIPLHNSAQLLESGVEITFSNGTYEAGEYWLIPARAATGDIEWPPVAGGPTAVRPFNNGPWFCPLALLTRSGANFTRLVDLRVDFPPLTAIQATDVSYDDSIVNIDGATNVQEALERLALRKTGGCTFHAAPGLGWESVFDEIPRGTDGEVCLEVGEYLLADVLRVVGKGHLVVSGRGRGTHVICPTEEAALQFIRCASVTVRNMRVTAGTSRDKPFRPGRNGSLECRDCGPVLIESVHARNRGTKPRSVACISVVRTTRRAASQALGRGDVTVRDCTLEVGLQQIGLQVVNARRATLTDNTIFPQAMEAPRVWAAIRASKQLRREVADLLVAHRRPMLAGKDQGSVGDDLTITDYWVNRTFVLDEHQVVAVAEPAIAERIVAYLSEAGPAGVQTPGDLSTHLRNALMNAMITDGIVFADSREAPNTRIGFDLLAGWIKDLQNRVITHASQGIVVGGRSADLVEIRGNEVFGAIQGIHVGLSHAGQAAQERDIAGRVEITKNHVTSAVLPFARARHGIFCGNAHSVLINDNVIRRITSNFETLSRLPLTGHTCARVHGAVHGGEEQRRARVCDRCALCAGGPQGISTTVADRRQSAALGGARGPGACGVREPGDPPREQCHRLVGFAVAERILAGRRLPKGVI